MRSTLLGLAQHGGRWGRNLSLANGDSDDVLRRDSLDATLAEELSDCVRHV